MSGILQKKSCKKMASTKSISLQVDSLVSLLASPAAAKGKKMIGFCGRKCCASWEKSSRGGYWAKTYQGFSQLLMFPGTGGGRLEPYCTTWPHWGIVSGGLVTELVKSAHRTKGRESLSWHTPDCSDRRSIKSKQQGLSNQVKLPTPTVNGLNTVVKMFPTSQRRDYKSGDNLGCERQLRKEKAGWGRNSNDIVKAFPTPTSSMWRGSTSKVIMADGKNRMNDRLDYAIEQQAEAKGQLNPDWVELLMGFDVGFTDIECDVPKAWLGWPAPLATKMTRTPQAHNGAQGAKSKEFYERCCKTNESSITLTDQAKHSGYGQYSYEPPRLVTGQKNRAKRLKALGNAVVPQQIFPVFQAIMEVEREAGNV